MHFSLEDVLVLYTDGVSDAQDSRHEFFGEDRPVAAVQASMDGSIGEIEGAILSAVKDFAGEAEQYDDIALVSLLREVE